MSEEAYDFESARTRLDEIAVQVRKKDTSLEKSLDLLEEGVRLANTCTEQIDQTQWRDAADVTVSERPVAGADEDPDQRAGASELAGEAAVELAGDGAPEIADEAEADAEAGDEPIPEIEGQTSADELLGGEHPLEEE
jgi:exodeoxyribonuclease VII small subunit